MNDDERLVTARDFVASGAAGTTMADLLDFAEERLRVNVGLVAENAELRRRVGVA